MEKQKSRKEYMREWRKKNHEHYLEVKRRYRTSLSSEQKKMNKKWCREYYQKHKNDKKLKEYKHNYYLNVYKKWRQEHRDIVNTQHKNYQQRQKMKVFTYYSGNPPKCACCGETHIEFLSIDHINNDGYAHRKLLGFCGNRIYTWLIKNNFPDGFQILCMNCQFGKRLNGVCPHKLEELHTQI